MKNQADKDEARRLTRLKGLYRGIYKGKQNDAEMERIFANPSLVKAITSILEEDPKTAIDRKGRLEAAISKHATISATVAARRTT